MDGKEHHRRATSRARRADDGLSHIQKVALPVLVVPSDVWDHSIALRILKVRPVPTRRTGTGRPSAHRRDAPMFPITYLLLVPSKEKVDHRVEREDMSVARGENRVGQFQSDRKNPGFTSTSPTLILSPIFILLASVTPFNPQKRRTEESQKKKAARPRPL